MSNPTAAARLNGLDSIRFVCALWVTFGHIGAPLPFTPPPSGALHKLFGLYGSIFNGPAAVIVFFVISGLCIHFPQRNGRTLDLRSFYLRRYIRIGIPAALSLLVPLVLTGPNSLHDFRSGILWSLIAEIIYYTVYPGLLSLRRRFGWRPLLAVSCLASLGVILTNPTAGNYPSYGDGLNWLLGLPCWLLGCLLAEKSNDPISASGSFRIWLWRGGIVIGGLVATILRWHLPHGISIGFPWSLTLFAIPVFFWLRQEIAYFQSHSPSRFLEWAGAWSYSLYLMHLYGPPALFRALGKTPSGEPFHSLLNLAGALGLAYLFYVVVERPSHRLATSLGRRNTTQDRTTVPLAAAIVTLSSGNEVEAEPDTPSSSPVGASQM